MARRPKYVPIEEMTKEQQEAELAELEKKMWAKTRTRTEYDRHLKLYDTLGYKKYNEFSKEEQDAITDLYHELMQNIPPKK